MKKLFGTEASGCRIMPFVLLGGGAFLLFALLTLPARLALGWLAPAQTRLEGISGTLWHGRAENLQWQEARLGRLEWRLHPTALLGARLRADLTLNRADGFAQATVTAGRQGRLRVTDLTASLPLNALSAIPSMGGWNGTLDLKFADLRLERGWPIQAAGRLDAVALSGWVGGWVGGSMGGSAGRPLRLGSYRVDFAPAADSTRAAVPAGTLIDTGGPLQVTGSVQLRADRSYIIEGLVTPRPEASSEIVQALQFLGPADAQGRRPFSLEGSF
ncbi:general secretion pathway protein N [Steroidobacter denitrificans]|uniref:Type II secretion system protein N n=1 Tax=Steroidobacter denitrificans TaxID=465721 RepID=A0A127FBQ0_STEDE|nr:type II secretion system protein N [Steroidobacter denitrificans]AMN46979.1 general secretion pathway protein N [Steroidobacter denitrificans]